MAISGNILIIDDEANIRQTLTRILQNAGCTVSTAINGAEALHRIAVASYDLILLDLRMPGMDGIAVLKEIRQSNPRQPVIVLTGHSSMSSALDALHLSAADYLIKPVNPVILVERTFKILRQQWIERRRHEIQEQMITLQEELKTLELESSSTSEISDRKSLPSSGSENRFLRVGDLLLDLDAKRVTWKDTAIDLFPSTFEYLAVLARHTPDIVAYQDLVSEAQGYETSLPEAR